jgi:hypothetical protein
MSEDLHSEERVKRLILPGLQDFEGYSEKYRRIFS